MGKKYNAFLSHNSQDKPVVEKIAVWLEDEAKLSVWLDKWNLIPGDPWQEEIEKALDESECCVIFLGPNGIGPWQNEEMRTAIDERVTTKKIRVVPVLLPNTLRPKEESRLPRFLRRLTWVVFQKDWQEEDALYRLVCGIKGIQPGRGKGEIQPEVCPFRGLEIFREQDQRFFFGREAVIQRLMDKLNFSRFLAVLGPSGCGKSSIVQAGIIPNLKEYHEVALFTPHERPIEELAFALRKCYLEDKMPSLEQLIKRLNESKKNLHYIAREVLENTDKKNLVLIIDQFEELFTQTSSEEERNQFISSIVNAVEVLNGPVMVILTMRSDFMGKCAFYPDINTYVTECLFQVEPMSIDELHLAIEEPAQIVGLRFESGLVDRILNDIRGAPLELPLMEHALLELYERRKELQLTSQVYNEIGGIEGALIKRAETEFEKLNDISKETLRKMFVLHLIQPGEGPDDTRRRATKEEILALDKDSQIAQNLLEQWTNARLLTTTRDNLRQQDLVEVAHEALIRKWDKIQTWMSENRESARQIGRLRQAAMEWKDSGRNPDYLFHGAQLFQMESLCNTHKEDLTPTEIEFVNAGIELHKKEERKKEELRQRELEIAKEKAESRAKKVKRLRFIIAGASSVLIILVILIINLFLKDNKIQFQLAMNYWEIAQQARNNGEYLYGLHLSAEAVILMKDQAIQKSLLLDMNDYWQCFPLTKIFPHDQSIKSAVFSSDGTRILTWSRDGIVRIWDTKTAQQIGSTLKHKEEVLGAKFNADNKRILTWSTDNTVRLWDATTGEQIETFSNHKERVLGAAFSADEAKILTWSMDKTARIWDANSGNQIGPDLEHEDWVLDAIFNSDGTRILTCSKDGAARVLNANTGKQIGPDLRHKEIKGALFNANETKILTWSKDGTTKLWNRKKGEQIGKDLKHQKKVLGAIFSADETKILTWSADKTARLWRVDKGEQVVPDMKHQGGVIGAKFNADETKILAWSKDGTARLWDARTGNQIGLALKHKRSVREATFSANENLVLIWSDDRTARLWNVNKGKHIGPIFKHHGIVMGAIFNTDETKILTWSEDGTARLWLADNGEQFVLEMIHQGGVIGAIFNADETKILTWSEDGTARLWNANTVKHAELSMNHEGGVIGAIFNADETKILTWSADGKARLWDANTEKQAVLILEHEGIVRGAIFNADETKILTWSEDWKARLWDANTGKQIESDMKHEGGVLGAIFNIDETEILTWSADGTIRLWDTNTGKQIGRAMDNQGAVLRAKINANKTRILACAGSKVRLWDVNNGKKIGKPFEHIGSVSGAIFNSNETKIIGWDSEGFVHLWDINTGKQIQIFEHQDWVKGAILNDDETRILTWSLDSTARLWDVKTGKQIGPKLMHKKIVLGAKLNLDETKILTWSEDGTARLWDIIVDWDFPIDKIKLQVMALTGTRLNAKTNKIESIEPEEWCHIKKKYMEFAKEHYKKCKYLNANVFRRLFPIEAGKVRMPKFETNPDDRNLKFKTKT